MRRSPITIAGALLLLAVEPASACEPVLPFLMVAGIPATVARSLFALVAAVAVKCLLFGALQRRISFLRAAIFMLIGNVLTTIIGMLAAGLIGAAPSGIPVMWIFTTPIVYALCLPAARRMASAAPANWILPRTPSLLAVLMTVALLSSCFVFLLARGAAMYDHLTLYWALKLVAVYLGLLFSISLTAFWEEWTVWRLSGCKATDLVFVKPAVRANLVVFLGLALYGAIVMLPARMKSPDFLVKNTLHTTAPPSSGITRH